MYYILVWRVALNFFAIHSLFLLGISMPRWRTSSAATYIITKESTFCSSSSSSSHTVIVVVVVVVVHGKNEPMILATLFPSILSPLYFQVYCPHSISKYIVPTLFPSILSPKMCAQFQKGVGNCNAAAFIMRFIAVLVCTAKQIRTIIGDHPFRKITKKKQSS